MRDKYEVYRDRGELDLYVYYLVQGITDLERRAQKVSNYTETFELSEGDQEKLAARLGKLDTRRAARCAYPEPPPPAPPAWHTHPATDKQIRYLRDAGYRHDLNGMTKGAARKLILLHKKLTVRWERVANSDDLSGAELKVSLYSFEQDLFEAGFDAEV